MRRIAVVGAFDTKAVPLGRLVDKLRALGEAPVTVDTGVFPSDRDCDHRAPEVARAAGRDIEELRTIGRAGAVAAMADGAARVVGRLVRDDSVGAVVCMGGPTRRRCSPGSFRPFRSAYPRSCSAPAWPARPAAS